MTELVARLHSNGTGARMREMFERFTWPLRKLAWKFEEKVLWRVADTFRRGPALPRTPRSAAYDEPASAWPTPSAEPSIERTEVASRRRLSPLRIRLGAPLRDVSIVLGTIAVAIGVGVGVATVVGHSDSTDAGSPAAPGPASAGVPQRQASAVAGPAEPTTLQGVTPDFKAKNSAATTSADAQASPTAATNAKPSSIPPGVAENITAIRTARDFAGAFVLYEVGQSSAKVRKTFARTATPALARALQDRPPRLPNSVSVPTAKVQNVVLGARTRRHIDASVSLLRVGDLSELRLDLIKRKGSWAVSEVRG
jgi:hypothetical protein